MKTITISISGSATKEVLKAIVQNNLKHQFIGVDQHYNILVQIHYHEEKQELITNIINYIEDMERLCMEFVEKFNNAFEKMRKDEELFRPKSSVKNWREDLWCGKFNKETTHGKR